MTIEQIKQHINKAEGTEITNLLMQQQEAEDKATGTKVRTDWFSHWENSKRVRVTMHSDVFKAVRLDREKGDLIPKRVEVKALAGKLGYIHYFVVVPSDIAGVL